MKIIVGLGNPGAEYESTRHNAGFIAIDRLAASAGLIWERDKKSQALIARSPELVLIKPLTFMNNSGQAVRAVLSYYRLLPKKLGLFQAKDSDLSALLTVFHDEVDLPLGEYRLSINKSSAGHRGVQSVIDHLRTKNFTRLRLGIRTELTGKIPTDKFVLQKFADGEQSTLEKCITDALNSIDR